ncbi:MAG TPA: response regulator [Myxococcaceae bacterium]
MSTIILVDDEHDMLELFTEVLEQMDHHVIRARDGLEALRLARETRPDMVVTDWMMPRMNGVELCQRMHEDARLRDIPIILHSSESNPHAPGVRFIPKSSGLDEFEGLVRRLLASTRQQRPEPIREVAYAFPPAQPLTPSPRAAAPPRNFSHQREA